MLAAVVAVAYVFTAYSFEVCFPMYLTEGLVCNDKNNTTKNDSQTIILFIHSVTILLSSF
jgi:hypothetical protein